MGNTVYIINTLAQISSVLSSVPHYVSCKYNFVAVVVVVVVVVVAILAVVLMFQFLFHQHTPWIWR